MTVVGEVYSDGKWLDSYTFERCELHESGRMTLFGVTRVQSYGGESNMPVEVFLPAHVTMIAKQEG